MIQPVADVKVMCIRHDRKNLIREVDGKWIVRS